MFVFFSFIHEEKERQITRTATQSPVISNTTNSSPAIIGPEISSQGKNLFWTRTLKAKFACMDWTPGRKFIWNNLVSDSLLLFQHRFHFRNPIICFFFLRKIPEQGKEDDILPII
jgi:hypothetical protein